MNDVYLSFLCEFVFYEVLQLSVLFKKMQLDAGSAVSSHTFHFVNGSYRLAGESEIRSTLRINSVPLTSCVVLYVPSLKLALFHCHRIRSHLIRTITSCLFHAIHDSKMRPAAGQAIFAHTNPFENGFTADRSQPVKLLSVDSAPLTVSPSET